MEHVEEEKTKREKELAALKNIPQTDEDIINNKKADIEALRDKLNDLLNETTQSLL